MHQATILNHLQLIEVTGEDAQEFLSNQFTSDVNALLDGKFQLSGWCNPKGRVLFTPILYRSGNSYFCLLPKDMAQQFCQRLTMFVLRSKVHIDSIDSHQAVAVSISESSKLEELRSATANDNEWVMLQSPWHSDDGSISHVLVGPKDSGLLADLNWLSQGDVAQWHCSRIIAGIPEINSATTEQFLPQQINLDALDGVSFKKGCYPGQEIVARVKYRGTVKQRLYILHGDSDIKETETPEPLSAVFGSSDSKIGQILDSQQCDEKCMALAVLDVAYCEQQLGTHDELVTVEGVATKFVLSHPPYPIAD